MSTSCCSSTRYESLGFALVLRLTRSLKIDILENKLKAGVKVARYVKSYGERPNEIDPVCKCKLPHLPVGGCLFD